MSENPRKRLNESDIAALLSELDSRDMAGFTRNFIDDFEKAIEIEQVAVSISKCVMDEK